MVKVCPGCPGMSTYVQVWPGMGRSRSNYDSQAGELLLGWIKDEIHEEEKTPQEQVK